MKALPDVIEIVITGKQGVGKSTLVEKVLVPALEQAGYRCVFFDDSFKVSSGTPGTPGKPVVQIEVGNSIADVVRLRRDDCDDDGPRAA